MNGFLKGFELNYLISSKTSIIIHLMFKLFGPFSFKPDACYWLSLKTKGNKRYNYHFCWKTIWLLCCLCVNHINNSLPGICKYFIMVPVFKSQKNQWHSEVYVFMSSLFNWSFKLDILKMQTMSYFNPVDYCCYI